MENKLVSRFCREYWHSTTTGSASLKPGIGGGSVCGPDSQKIF